MSTFFRTQNPGFQNPWYHTPPLVSYMPPLGVTQAASWSHTGPLLVSYRPPLGVEQSFFLEPSAAPLWRKAHSWQKGSPNTPPPLLRAGRGAPLWRKTRGRRDHQTPPCFEQGGRDHPLSSPQGPWDWPRRMCWLLLAHPVRELDLEDGGGTEGAPLGLLGWSQTTWATPNHPTASRWAPPWLRLGWRRRRRSMGIRRHRPCNPRLMIAGPA